MVAGRYQNVFWFFFKHSFQGFLFLCQSYGTSGPKFPFLNCQRCVLPLSPERKGTISGKTFPGSYRSNERVYVHKRNLFSFFLSPSSAGTDRPSAPRSFPQLPHLQGLRHGFLFLLCRTCRVHSLIKFLLYSAVLFTLVTMF